MPIHRTSRESFDERRDWMVRHDLAERGVTDVRVLAALGTVPREEFVPSSGSSHAYDDCALPIGEGQSISQPYVVGAMLEGLELLPDDRLLEVGAGSGYAMAVASLVCDRVIGLERVETLASLAADRLERLGYSGVSVIQGDGTLGWPDEAPYTAILVSAGGPRVPPALLAQLAEGGRLVMPVGQSWSQQHLLRIRRTASGLEQSDLGAVAFVPLIGDQGWPA